MPTVNDARDHSGNIDTRKRSDLKKVVVEVAALLKCNQKGALETEVQRDAALDDVASGREASYHPDLLSFPLEEGAVVREPNVSSPHLYL